MSITRFGGMYIAECDNCGDELATESSWEDAKATAEDDGMVFVEGQNLCKTCAEEEGYKCPECGNFKKPNYETCYDCNQ